MILFNFKPVFLYFLNLVLVKGLKVECSYKIFDWGGLGYLFTCGVRTRNTEDGCLVHGFTGARDV